MTTANVAMLQLIESRDLFSWLGVVPALGYHN